MRVGFIGTGVIAGAMVRAIAADGHQIWVSERNAKIAGELAQEHSNVTVTSNQGVDPVLAEGFLRQLVGGFLLSEPLDEPHVAAMAASLGTPGGLNATLDQLLTDGGDAEHLASGLDQLKNSLA